jgi:hypothetical protein
MTTIKFPRPNGEARLEWRPDDADEPSKDGGWVRIVDSDGELLCNYDGPGGELDDSQARIDMAGLVSDESQTKLLLAAESLRNERRRLAENEWRDPVTGDVMTFSRPTLVGFDRKSTGWKQVFASEWHLGPVGEHTEKQGWYIAALKWHRAAYFPLLKPDECYPPGELPRKMAEDEVRGIHGDALKLELASDGPRCGVRIDGKWWWDDQFAGSDLRFIDDMHPAKVQGQLARLQAFWDANQPKEDGPPEEAKPKCQKCNGTGRSCGDRHCPYQWCTPCVACAEPDITIGGTGTVEERLRVAHAALSDHIRRGDSIETDDRAFDVLYIGHPYPDKDTRAEEWWDLLQRARAAEAKLNQYPAAPDLTELR